LIIIAFNQLFGKGPPGYKQLHLEMDIIEEALSLTDGSSQGKIDIELDEEALLEESI